MNGLPKAGFPWRAGPGAMAIDFVPVRRHVGFGGWVLAVAGLVAAGLAGQEYQLAQEELARVEARQARSLRTPAAPGSSAQRPAPEPRTDSAGIDRMGQLLRTPWAGLFQVIETAAQPGVVLLSVEASAANRSARIVGEAGSLPEALAYLGRLRSAPAVRDATLSGHEMRAIGSANVVRFTLDLDWGTPP